ncbi:MAG: mandelate racemase/muconate lactonizing enzyme family protein [Hyphomicrobiales bacterium]|nr:mandelate racemase/muconate lactonizing enzyme family protein [Hyphomicrobiales bacterium]
MKIVAIETVRVSEFSNLLLLRLHTNEGLTGLGETFRNVGAIESYIHETLAPFLIGQNPLDREALSHGMARTMGNHYKGFPTRSVEIRGNSAVDIALWDLGGKARNMPAFEMLGGLTNDKIAVYNTCAGAAYNNKARVDYDSEIWTRNSGRPPRIDACEDLLLQVHDPARLAHELLDEGITALKIWPFDAIACKNRGLSITASELRDAIWPVEQIRRAVGDRIEILIEYHGLWQLAPALKIARALEEFDIYWHEDPLWMQNFDDLARYNDAVDTRLCGSENMGTLAWYREVFRRSSVDVANFDIAWIGGLTEGMKITHFAEAFDRPIAPHDCTGPVTLTANVHLLSASPNALIAETVRAYFQKFYPRIVTELPKVENGFVQTLTGPGLGTELRDDFLAREDVHTRISGKPCQ